jgi:hypothetical protein
MVRKSLELRANSAPALRQRCDTRAYQRNILISLIL